MKGIIGLLITGLVIVIAVQWFKAGSSGPNVVKNLFANITGYISLLK